MGSVERFNDLTLNNPISSTCKNNKMEAVHKPSKFTLSNGTIIGRKGLLTPPRSRLMWQKARKYFPTIAKIVTSLALWFSIFVYVVGPLWPVILIYYVSKLAEQIIMFVLHGAFPFDSTDALWMQERPENRTIINALLVLQGEVDISVARKLIYDRMIDAKDESGQLLYPRVRKYAYSGHLNFFWIEEERLNVDDHVQLWNECTYTKRQQRIILSMLCSRPFQNKKSPWEIILIPHTDKVGSKTTSVLFRAHHSMADGISLARLLIRVLPDNEPVEIPIRKFPARHRFLLYLKGIFFGPLFMIFMLCSIPDKSIIHGRELEGKKKLTWSKAMDLSLIKRIKNATKVTVNDVLMSCYSAALRDFFIERGQTPPDSFPVALPVDLRPDNNKHAVRFKNNFAMIPFRLAINIKDPLLQLHETRKRMNALKASGEPFSVNLGMKLFSCLLPHFLTKPMCKFACEKTTAVLSNIPGPQNRMQIGGHELESITFWPPQRDRIGMGLSMSTYNGKLFVGVESDEALKLDPDEICKKYETQLKRLAARVGVQG